MPKAADLPPGLADADADLLIAATKDRLDLLDAALAKGARLNTKNNRGRTALMLAAERRNMRVLSRLLEAGAKVDDAHRGETALICACRAGATDIVRRLLEYGADADRRYRKKNVAFLVAYTLGNADIIKLLLLYGAQPPEKLPDRREISARGGVTRDHPEIERLVKQARKGNQPVVAPRFATHKACEVCRHLPKSIGWNYDYDDGTRTGDDIPPATECFEIFTGGVWKCPHCSTYYEFVHDRDAAYLGAYESEHLWRRSPEWALKILYAEKSMAPNHWAWIPWTPRLDREIEALERTLGINTVNINTADIDALMSLPGIGRRTAQRIIDDRNTSGPFSSCLELCRVSGIGDATVEKLLPLCRI
jgi:competence ComEA-like helix-hairpin-helix protein